MEGTISTPTASSTPAPTSTSVSTGTTSASPTPAERPTFAQAFATDAATQTPPSTETGTATTQPAEGTDPQSATPPSTEAQGPIPYAVHKQTLENARTKAVTEYRQTAGIDKAVDFATRINTDKVAFLRDYTREVLTDPVAGPAARAELARMFGGLRQTAAPQPAAAPAAEPMPPADVQIVDANGTVVGMTYSDKQQDLRDAWKERRQEAARQKSETDKKTAEAKAVEWKKQANAKLDETMAEVADVLDLDESTPKEQRVQFFAKVNELMAQNPRMSAHRAALLVRNTVIKPAQAGKAEANVLESLKTKAAAQTVNPAGAVVAASSRPRSFMDKSLKW